MGLDHRAVAFSGALPKATDDDAYNAAEFFYARSNYRLQEWMQRLYDQRTERVRERMKVARMSFCGPYMRLRRRDLDQLEADLFSGLFQDLYEITPFETDKSERKRILKFIRKARKLILMGKKVYFNASL